MVAQLTRVADARFGAGEWSVDRVMRQIPEPLPRPRARPELVVPPARTALTPPRVAAAGRRLGRAIAGGGRRSRPP